MLRTERWMAASLALLWLWSGVQPWLGARAGSLASVLDLGCAAACLWRPTPAGARAQLALVAGYSLIVGVGLPQMWQHPFAPLVKNLPILAMLLHLAAVEPPHHD